MEIDHVLINLGLSARHAGEQADFSAPKSIGEHVDIGEVIGLLEARQEHGGRCDRVEAVDVAAFGVYFERVEPIDDPLLLTITAVGLIQRRGAVVSEARTGLRALHSVGQHLVQVSEMIRMRTVSQLNETENFRRGIDGVCVCRSAIKP